MTPDELRRRNIAIAGCVGGVLLPLAGLVGALILHARGEIRLSVMVFCASLVGVALYLALFL